MNKNDFNNISENLVRVVMAIMAVYKKESKEKPFVHDPAYMILGILLWKDMPISEIGSKLCRSKPSMTALIDKMIEDGLVKRIDDKEDRRIINISITDRGRTMMRRKKEKMKEILKNNLENLEKEDIKKMDVALEEIVSILKKNACRKK
jgi:DNA-binding MarR family transcriptional regulator